VTVWYSRGVTEPEHNEDEDREVPAEEQAPDNMVEVDPDADPAPNTAHPH
jgi:hypothetical protein